MSRHFLRKKSIEKIFLDKQHIEEVDLRTIRILKIQ